MAQPSARLPARRAARNAESSATGSRICTACAHVSDAETGVKVKKDADQGDVVEVGDGETVVGTVAVDVAALGTDLCAEEHPAKSPISVTAATIKPTRVRLGRGAIAVKTATTDRASPEPVIDLLRTANESPATQIEPDSEADAPARRDWSSWAGCESA